MCGVLYHEHMNPDLESRILDVFSAHGGYARADVLRDAGAHPAQLASLVSSGRIVRIKRGFYAISEESIPRSELVDVQRSVPGSIFCLGTALSLHGIGTWEPPEVQLAILRDSRIKLPNQPPISLFSFSKDRYELGVMELETIGGVVRVYNREKTICDVLRFRNAIGHDIVNEALKEYLGHREKDIQKLVEYATALRMEGTVRRYLEVLA